MKRLATGPNTREIVGADTVIAHYEITVLRDAHRTKIAQVPRTAAERMVREQFYPSTVERRPGGFSTASPGQTNNAL